MVLAVRTDAGEITHDLNAAEPQVRRITEAGPWQQPRGFERPGAKGRLTPRALRPCVVVAGLSTDTDHGVRRGRSADHVRKRAGAA